MNDQQSLQPNIQPETPQQKTKRPVWVVILIAVLSAVVIGLGSYAVYRYFVLKPTFFVHEPLFCAEDVKICPDGSSIGRILPDCEFASCPEVVDPTADWQTYRNEEYGYEIGYPKNLIIDNSNPSKISIGSSAVAYVNITAYPSKTNMDFQSFVQEKLQEEFGGMLDMSAIKWVQKEIQGEQTIEASFKNITGGYTGEVTWNYIPKEGKVYKIALLSNFKVEGSLVSYPALHNQILSTFKFIK